MTISTVDGVLKRGNFVLATDESMKSLLRAEDIDGDCLITVDDGGPKVYRSIVRFVQSC